MVEEYKVYILKKANKDKEKDLKLILRRFDKLSFDGKFIITALLHIYRY